MLNVWANKPGVDIHRLGSTEMAKTRSAEVRWSYRQEKFTEYFRDSRPVDLSLNNVAVVCSDLPLLSPERYDQTSKGRVLGLNDGDCFTIGLGIWEKSDLASRRVRVLTPLKGIEPVNLIQVGDVALQLA